MQFWVTSKFNWNRICTKFVLKCRALVCQNNLFEMEWNRTLEKFENKAKTTYIQIEIYFRTCKYSWMSLHSAQPHKNSELCCLALSCKLRGKMHPSAAWIPYTLLVEMHTQTNDSILWNKLHWLCNEKIQQRFKSSSQDDKLYQWNWASILI